ncbi:MAG: glycosyl hydrolase family 65 protein [Gemmatimonadaceae bacterium]
MHNEKSINAGLDAPLGRHYSYPSATPPETDLLSNGRYSVMITSAGSGFSCWEDIAVTRWHGDATSDDTGAYIFLRDVADGKSWSAGFQPSGKAPDRYEVSFAEDRAQIMRQDGLIATLLDVIVSPDDDAEIRRVSLTNHGSRAREIDVTSYAELVLASAATDAGHPAFSNLFVQTEILTDRDTLLATRRRHAHNDPEYWLAHVVAVEGDTVGDLEWETNREQFLGRGQTVHTARANTDGAKLSNTVGSVLDPIASLRRRVRILPGNTARVVFTTLVGPSRDAVMDVASKYRDASMFDRAAALALTTARDQLQRLGIEPEEAQLFQMLSGSIMYLNPALRASTDVIARRSEGVGALWAHGISGDLPIVLLEICDAGAMDTVRQLLRARAYFTAKHLAADIVILNNGVPSAASDLQTQLESAVKADASAPYAKDTEPLGKVFNLRSDGITAAQRDVLEGAARVVLSSLRGTLAAQIADARRARTSISAPNVTPIPELVTAQPPSSSATLAAHDDSPPHPELEFYNGVGGFDAERGEYVITLQPGHWTPAPWVNVIANPQFGCMVSEAGAGCTWSINSQLNILTPWSNDPVSDPPSEMFYIRDEDSGELWSPTPLPIREQGSEYVVRHGHGYTRHSYDAHDIALELLQFVPVDDPIKISRLTLTNRSARTRRLRVSAYLEWVLGVLRTGSAPFVVTEMDPATGAMFARNSWNEDFAARIAFADLGGAQQSWTGDRAEFLGCNGILAEPAALSGSAQLSGRTGAALDPCCALQTTVEIPADGSISVVCFLGEAESREQARNLIQRYRTDDLDSRLKAVTESWDNVLGSLQVKTPDRSLDLLLNQWLLYQTLSCRVWARTAFYQASGAYGFRDQLQDVMALTVARPDITRAQVLLAASRQFIEGDVQHWWHEPIGRGIRTHVSDDLLWLPYVASHYLDVTGDRQILDEMIPFLEGPVLKPDQVDAYFQPKISAEHGTIFEHCARTLDHSLAVGVHGLPLMGTGDWNDGMNLVGVKGKGESVWLAWFLYTVLAKWALIASARGETNRAQTWADHAAKIKEAAEENAWDGNWYRRAYFDDGTPLGTAGSDACAIDSIAQSWSVMSGAADPVRARRAMTSVDEHLVRRDVDIILLLTPPFDHTELKPGYIKGYVPGVRENGGQYTHGSVWTVIAFAELGDGEKTAELFSMLNPITHTATAPDVRQYRVEPYVTVGDVYSVAPHAGHGGWSWYTGSAGWLYRAGTEWLLGIQVQGDRLVVDPCIPSSWSGFSATLRYRSAQYEITVENPSGVCGGITVLELDSVASSDRETDGRASVSLKDDHQSHKVRAVLGSNAGVAR